MPTLAGLRAELNRLRGEVSRRLAPRTDPILDRLRLDPALPMRAAGLTPDPWQEALIRDPARQVAALCTRRSGKTRTVASRVLARCLTRKSQVLLFAPTEDQSKELLQYVREMNDAIGCPVPLVRESQSELAWANGSRVKAKTDRAKSARGFTPDLIVIDEAAQVSDELYLSVMPMLILGAAELLALTTPFGKLGWFFEMWDTPAKRRSWQTYTITAYQCPRIRADILAEHRATMPPRWFNQEYLCHRPTSKVLLWSGEHQEVGKLVAGDELCHLDRATGEVNPCRVVAVRDTGMAVTHRVVLETGDEFVASAGHHVHTRTGRTPLAEAAHLHVAATDRPAAGGQAALARLVAFNTGDGTISRRPSGVLQAAFYSKHREDLEAVAADVVTAGLSEQLPAIGVKKAKPGMPDTYQIQLSNTPATRLVDMGCPVGKKVESVFPVPAWVMEGGPVIRREYVAALWGAEGSCLAPVGRGCGHSRLAISMAKAIGVDGGGFWRQVAGIMTENGVPTTLTTAVRSGRDCYTLLVTGGGGGVVRFLRNVGYRYSRYKSVAGFEWRCYLLARKAAGAQRVEQVKRLVAEGLTYREVGERLGCSKDVAFFLNSGTVAGERINGFADFDAWVATRRSGSGLYLSVASRLDLPPERVVNIQVDSPDHSYLMADGLDNYNCEFNDAIDAVFGRDVIDAAEKDDAMFAPLAL